MNNKLMALANRVKLSHGYELSNEIAEIARGVDGWISVTDSGLVQDGYYWVKFPNKEAPVMCSLNNYMKWGGCNNMWQDLKHNDHPMKGTQYIKIESPTPPAKDES